MKRIYTFTLGSDEGPSFSRRFENDLRLIAYMLYSEIFNYYGEDHSPLNINDKIEINNLNEDYHEHKYKFDSDLFDNGYIYYEPFIVGDNTFAFTITDESFNEDIIRNLVQYILNLLNLDYKVTINSFVYEAKNINDEKNRNEAIRLIFDKFGCKCNRKSGIMHMMMNAVYNKRRIRNRRRNCYGYY